MSLCRSYVLEILAIQSTKMPTKIFPIMLSSDYKSESEQEGLEIQTEEILLIIQKVSLFACYN